MMTFFLVSAREYRPRIDFSERWGLCVGIYPEKRHTPIASFKSLNYLFYQKAREWAFKHNFEEAIILNPDGSISEGSSTNIVLIKENRALIPCSTYFLKGIMLDKALGFLTSRGYLLVEKKIFPNELDDMDEVILTNSLIGAIDVSSIDNKDLKKAKVSTGI